MTLWFLPLFCMRFGFLYKEFFVHDAEFEFSRAIFRKLLLILYKEIWQQYTMYFYEPDVFLMDEKSVALFERCVFF